MSATRDNNRVMISAIERARRRRQQLPSSQMLSVALMAVFFLVLMGGLTSGAIMYRSAVADQQLAMERHLQSGLIANVVRANDRADSVRVDQGPEGPALVMVRRLNTRAYETRIYLYEGTVMQETAVEGVPYDPAGATPLLKSTSFDVSIDDGLVTFTTDYGSFSVALRSNEAVQS